MLLFKVTEKSFLPFKKVDIRDMEIEHSVQVLQDIIT